MSGPAVIFREIHRLRRYARDLQEQLDRIPRQVKAHQAKVAQRETALREAQDYLRKLKVGIHEREVTLETRNNQIKKYEKQLNEVSSKKEYDALQLEIANAKANCAQLEDEILNGLTESEERAAQLPDLEKAIGVAKEELARIEQEGTVRKADLNVQLQRAREQLAEVETKVPAALLGTYRRLVTARDADALAAVRSRACTACYTEITQQAYGDLLRENFVQCKSCDRILYLPEDTTRPTEADEDED